MQGERNDFERLGPAGEHATAAAGARSVRRAEQVEGESDGSVRLAPRGVGALADLGVEFTAARFAPAVLLASLLWLPAQATSAFLLPDPQSLGMNPDSEAEYYALTFLVNGVSAFVALLTSALSVLLAVDGFHGTRTPLSTALRRAVTRVPGLLVVAILSGFLIVAGFFVFCVGVFIAWWIVVLMPTVYVIERVRIRDVLSRATRLTHAKFVSWDSFFGLMRWFGFYVVLVSLTGGFSGLASWSVTHEMRTLVLENVSISYTTYTVLSIVVGSVFMAVASVINAGFMTAYWVDCRVRRDGLDLRRWLERVQRDTAPVPSGSRA